MKNVVDTPRFDIKHFVWDKDAARLVTGYSIRHVSFWVINTETKNGVLYDRKTRDPSVWYNIYRPVEMNEHFFRTRWQEEMVYIPDVKSPTVGESIPILRT